MRKPIESAAEAGRAQLIRLLGGFAPTPLAILRRQGLAIGSGAFRAEALTLTAGAAGETIRGFLVGPEEPWQGRPALLYLHAHGFDYAIGAEELLRGRPALLDPPYGRALAEAGFVALCIDVACFGARAQDQESALAKRHLWQGTTLFGAMLADLAGAFDLLAGIEGVDPARIGAVGISMGATQAFWLGAIEPRLGAIAHLCCFADLETLIAAGAHDLHGVYMVVPGLISEIRTGEIAGLAAPRPQLVCLGAKDPLTPPAAIERGLADLRAAYDRHGAAENLEILLEPESGHVETPQMRAAVLDFFRRTLLP